MNKYILAALSLVIAAGSASLAMGGPPQTTPNRPTRVRVTNLPTVQTVDGAVSIDGPVQVEGPVTVEGTLETTPRLTFTSKVADPSFSGGLSSPASLRYSCPIDQVYVIDRISITTYATGGSGFGVPIDFVGRLRIHIPVADVENNATRTA